MLQFDGQVVEQQRMRGRSNGRTEVLQGFDNADAEKLGPESIRQHSGGQRIVWGNQPPSELQSARVITREMMQLLGNAGRYQFSVVQPIAADKLPRRSGRHCTA